MVERALFKAVISLIIKQDDKVLLFFRNDGPFGYDGGWWVLPAGHVEHGETAQTAAIREAKEELGIDIDPSDIKCVHIISNLASIPESYDIIFEVSKYTGTIRNCEADKCVEMRFFALNEIKKLDHLISTTRMALDGWAKNRFYSECLSYFNPF
ncbi:MAG: NUDIX domain-containing protein [Alphaproteobacteria bacterium]|nr:NUDIX domain-containing protein [Alphaproteobacteria bacterium]